MSKEEMAIFPVDSENYYEKMIEIDRNSRCARNSLKREN